jgi:hypothetical protein
MIDKKETESEQVLGHVKRAETSIGNFRREGTTSEGALRNPKIQAAALRLAREELGKAIAILEHAKWR